MCIRDRYPDEESGIQVESLDVVSVQDGVEKGLSLIHISCTAT